MAATDNDITPVVEAISTLHLEGNIIPPSWLQHIRTDRNKPAFLAAMILGDLIYWYRWTVVRDEMTGDVIAYRKKFSSDKLQRDASYYARLFG